MRDGIQLSENTRVDEMQISSPANLSSRLERQNLGLRLGVLLEGRYGPMHFRAALTIRRAAQLDAGPRGEEGGNSVAAMLGEEMDVGPRGIEVRKIGVLKKETGAQKEGVDMASTFISKGADGNDEYMGREMEQAFSFSVFGFCRSCGWGAYHRYRMWDRQLDCLDPRSSKYLRIEAIDYEELFVEALKERNTIRDNCTPR